MDIALRYGEPADSGLIALPVAPENRRVLCASRAYLKAHGTPSSPNDLKAHNCLCFMLRDRIHDRWHFTRGKEKWTVQVKGRVQCDDSGAVRQLAHVGTVPPRERAARCRRIPRERLDMPALVLELGRCDRHMGRCEGVPSRPA